MFKTDGLLAALLQMHDSQMTPHDAMPQVSERTVCEATEAGAECQEEVRRLEEDVVTADQSCRHTEAELCGPANCKFVNVTLECHEKTSSVTAELRRRECTVCEPKLADTVEVGSRDKQNYE